MEVVTTGGVASGAGALGEGGGTFVGAALGVGVADGTARDVAGAVAVRVRLGVGRGISTGVGAVAGVGDEANSEVELAGGVVANRGTGGADGRVQLAANDSPAINRVR